MILLRPVPTRYPISQQYGENPNLYPSTHGHNGIDYAVPEGTLVVAAADGLVTRAELDTETAANPKAGYGIHVRIQHANGYMTIYGHLAAASVVTGWTVHQGETIGVSGNTGRSTGPHLHFELRAGVSMYSALDPSAMIVDAIPEQSGLFVATLAEDGKGLRVRNRPTTEAAVIRSMSVGEKVKVFGFAGGDCWLQIEDGYIKYGKTWLTLEGE